MSVERALILHVLLFASPLPSQKPLEKGCSSVILDYVSGEGGICEEKRANVPPTERARPRCCPRGGQKVQPARQMGERRSGRAVPLLRCRPRRCRSPPGFRLAGPSVMRLPCRSARRGTSGCDYFPDCAVRSRARVEEMCGTVLGGTAWTAGCD